MTTVLWIVGGWLGLNVAVAVVAGVYALLTSDRPRDIHDVLDQALERQSD